MHSNKFVFDPKNGEGGRIIPFPPFQKLEGAAASVSLVPGCIIIVIFE